MEMVNIRTNSESYSELPAQLSCTVQMRELERIVSEDCVLVTGEMSFRELKAKEMNELVDEYA